MVEKDSPVRGEFEGCMNLVLFVRRREEGEGGEGERGRRVEVGGEERGGKVTFGFPVVLYLVAGGIPETAICDISILQKKINK